MNLNKLLDHTVTTIHAAGQLVLTYYRKRYDTWDKSPDNPVTDADLAADALLKQRLLAETPDFGWLSEETVDTPERLDKELVWVVDPIDGTKEFIKGVDQFSISVGLAHNGHPVLGVVYNPARDETFAGLAENGLTHIPDTKRRFSNRVNVLGAQVLISDTEHTRGVWDDYKTDLDLKPTGSTAYKLALIAAGFGDAYTTLRPKNEWDYCAGAALVLAAGGKISDLNGKPLTFNRKKTLVNGIVAANPKLHKGLLNLFTSANLE